MAQVKGAQQKHHKLALLNRLIRHSLEPVGLTDKKQVGDRLMRLHHEAEAKNGALTQQEIAQAIGVAYRTFQTWEGGRNESRDRENYERLAKFYSRQLEREITANWILFGSDEGPEFPSVERTILETVEHQGQLLVELGEAVDELREALGHRQQPPGSPERQA